MHASSCHVTPCHTALRHVTPRYVTSCQIRPDHSIALHSIACHVVYRIVSCFLYHTKCDPSHMGDRIAIDCKKMWALYTHCAGNYPISQSLAYGTVHVISQQDIP